MKSASTQPFDPKSVAHWHNVIQNAGAVPKSSSEYADARAVVRLAADQIKALNNAANDAEKAPSPQGPRVLDAALAGAAQGATSGLADEYLGAMNAFMDRSRPVNRATVDSSINAQRQQFSDARLAHPIAAMAGNVGGALENPLNYLLGPLTKGLGLAAKGGVYGGALGAAQGLGEGDNTGERVFGGVAGGVIGAAGGAGLGWLAGKVGPPTKIMWTNLRGAFAKTERQVVSALGKGTTPETVQQVQEAAHRAYLTKNGFPPETIDRLMETWRAGGKLPTQPPAQPTVEVPVTARPGETISQIAPQGFEVTGTRATPPAPTTPSFHEAMYGTPVRDLGKGNVLPYYPRGGAVEQSMAPFPASSPSGQNAVMEKQLPMMLEWLKASPAGEESLRIETLRALGVPLGPQAETDLLTFLGRTPR